MDRPCERDTSERTFLGIGAVSQAFHEEFDSWPAQAPFLGLCLRRDHEILPGRLFTFIDPSP